MGADSGAAKDGAPRRNEVAIMGTKGSGKTHIVQAIGATLTLETKYFSADVHVTEVAAGGEAEDESAAHASRAWVLVVRNTEADFRSLVASVSVQRAPDRRLLVVNQVAAGDGLDVHDFVLSDLVFGWCMNNQFEAVPMPHEAAPAALSPDDKAGLLARRLLDTASEPVGVARVFQALAQTVWESRPEAAPTVEDAGAAAAAALAADAAPAAADAPEVAYTDVATGEVEGGDRNRALLYFDGELDGFPEECVHFLSGAGGGAASGGAGDDAAGAAATVMRIQNKYYSAEVHVEARDVSPALDAASAASAESGLVFYDSARYHAVVACCRSEATLTRFLDAFAASDATLHATPEVGVLLCVGTFSEEARERAVAWALRHEFEPLLVSGFDAAAATAADGSGELGRREADEEDTIHRLRDAMEATQWPLMEMVPRPQKPKKATEVVVAEAEAEEEEVSKGAEELAEDKEEAVVVDDRWRRRCASGVGSAGCELPPGWIFDRKKERSRPLDPLEVRTREADPLMHIDDDDEDEPADVQALDYDRLLQEAMFLRNKGAALDDDERRERAGQVAMQLAGLSM